MRCRITFGVVAVLLLAGLVHAQATEFKVEERSLDDEIRLVKRYDWVAVKSRLIITIPENWVVNYAVITKEGAVKQTGEYTGPNTIDHPVSENGTHVFGAAEGNFIHVDAYKKNPDPEGKPLQSTFYKLRIVKEGVVFLSADNLAFTPVIMYEFNKKANPADDKTKDVAPGIGALYLFTIRNVERKWLAQFPILGVNVSFADSRVLKEGEKALESSGVISGGLAVGWKPFPGSGFMILGIVGAGNLLGDNFYPYVGAGFGSFLTGE